jgi:hypothetical protein
MVTPSMIWSYTLLLLTLAVVNITRAIEKDFGEFTAEALRTLRKEF